MTLITQLDNRYNEKKQKILLVIDWKPVQDVSCLSQYPCWDMLQFPVTISRITKLINGWIDKVTFPF